MTDLIIEPHREGDLGVTSHKSIVLKSEEGVDKREDTPAKAVEIDNVADYEEIVDTARGVNEIYTEFDSKTIEEVRRGHNRNWVRNVTRPLNKARDGEINVVILKYTGKKELAKDDLRWLMDFLENHSDIVVTPLMPEIAREAVDRDDDAINTTHFENYRNNIEKALDATEEIGAEQPIMGTFSVQFPWECNRLLYGLYRNNEVTAFCANFDRRTITAERQIEEFVTPLYQELNEEGISDRVLTYAVNVKRKSNRDSKPSPTARDFVSFMHGFDILGENHEGLRLPPEELEKLKKKFRNRPTQMDVFNKDEYVYHETTHGDIDEHFPKETSLDISRVKQRLRQREEPPYALRALLNSEQMAIAARELRIAVQSGDSRDHIVSKTGITESELETVESLQSSIES